MKRLLAAIAVALMLAGCEARLEMEVKHDGSGNMGFSFVVEDTYLAALGAFGAADPFAEMKEELEKGTVPFKVEEFRDEKIKGRGIRANVPFENVEEMKSLIGELNESGDSSPFGEGGFEDFTLERRGDGWHFSATSPAPDFGELSLPSGGLGPGGEDITKIFKFSLRVTLPGRSTNTTATDTQRAGASTTFVWVPDLKNPKPLQLVATTSGAGSAASEFPVIPVAAAGGGLALAAIVAAVLASKRRQPVLAPPEAAMAPPMGPPSGPPPSGPPAP